MASSTTSSSRPSKPSRNPEIHGRHAMSRTKPPYRADVVGSLLRTAPIKEARAKREKNEITAAELKTVEDAEIDKIIRQAGRGRPAARDRRRVPPRLVALRLLRHVGRGGGGRVRPRHPVPGRPDQGAGVARQRQNRLPRIASDAGALPLSEGAHQGHAQDDHPEPERHAFPARSERRRPGGLSGPRRHPRRSGDDVSADHQGLLRRRLPLPAVRRYGLGLSVLRGPAAPGGSPRARRQEPGRSNTPA